MSSSLENLGHAFALVEQGELGQADALCVEISRSDPAIHTAHYLRGLIAFQRGQPEQSIDHLNAAEALAPDDGGLKKTFASILLASGDHAGAAEKFAFVISEHPGILNSSDALSLAQLGEGLRQAGRLGDAIEFFAQSVRLRPEDNPATTGLFLCGQLACDWRDLECLEEGVEAQTQSSLKAGHCPVEDPFVHITRCMDSRANLEVARAWSDPLSKAASKAAGAADVNSVPCFPLGDESQPIRLGYLSSDLHEHATAYLMHRLFEMHDREFFEVIAYSCSPGDGSAIRKKLETDCDTFRDINGWDADRAAALMANDGIQILIDLKGHTRKNRLDIAACRPAPLQ
ncbi:MAG: tetratricopeptide repeat protein, partial [Proteobacteria bacterium]|nr:tetratricopeptide repeat protein [Pseudomonadota bacterium]